ncbi:MAG: nitroreductase family protein [Rikenellaceae bacterium]|nr:nitroreductase family protein [Rikenellaceae bacterium]
MINEIRNHRSVRSYTGEPVSEEVLDEILTAATRASTTGNMQLYSIVVTQDAEMREKLAPCHFNQPCVVQAPVLLTFCADIRRFSLWCRQRGAEPVYDNFAWFVNAATDALLASQNAALEAEAHGLGICYLGTAIYTARQICEILSLPEGVVPVTAMVVGHPATETPLTDRLPVDGVVHREIYRDYTPEDIDRIWHKRERSEETAGLLEANGLPNLARIFTERRYRGEDNLAISRSYMECLREQGFFNQ